jgi:hypothetical protein
VCWASAMSIQLENNETQCRKNHCVDGQESILEKKKSAKSGSRKLLKL